MAMFISKFHKLIESKIFWYGIIGIMIVTMTLSLVPNVHDWNGFVRGFVAGKAGYVNGREVSESEYRQANLLSRRSTLFDRENANAAWEWIAVQDKAAELGLEANAQDLAKMVYENVTRQTGGKWDDSNYAQFIAMIAERNDIPPNQLKLAEELLRQDMSLQRALGTYASGLLVTPGEMRRVFSDFFDSFDLEVATLAKPAAATNEVAISEEQLVAHYEQNKDDYRTPPQRRALFSRINIMQLANTNQITETVAREYYDRNLSQYLIRSTNAVDVLSATNSYVAYSDARTGILFKLAYEEAAEAVKSDAAKLYERLLPGRGKTVENFEEVMSSFGYQIETSEWVSANGFVPGVEKGREFARALFDLDAGSVGEVIEPLVASNSVYLAKFLDFRPERVPELAEIKDRVTSEVRRKLESESALAEARKMRDTLQAAIASGASFTNAAKQAGLEVRAVQNVQLSAQTADLPNDLKKEMLRAVPGEILAPVAEPNGTHLIARVMARKPADGAQFKEFEGRIRDSLRQQRAMAAATAYKKSIASSAKIEPAKGYETAAKED